MRKTKSRPPEVPGPDHDDPDAWRIRIEATDGYLWRYEIHITCGAMRWSNEGGDYAFTLAGARRKGGAAAAAPPAPTAS